MYCSVCSSLMERACGFLHIKLGCHVSVRFFDLMKSIILTFSFMSQVFEKRFLLCSVWSDGVRGQSQASLDKVLWSLRCEVEWPFNSWPAAAFPLRPVGSADRPRPLFRTEVLMDCSAFPQTAHQSAGFLSRSNSFSMWSPSDSWSVARLVYGDDHS